MKSGQTLSKKSLLLKKFIFENWIYFTCVLFFGIVGSIITILIPVSISKYYSLIFQTNSSRSFILGIFPENWVNYLPNFLFFFFGLIFFWMIFSFLQKYITGILGELFTKSIRESLFQHQLSVEMKIYDETGFGKYLLRYSGDLSSIRNYLTNGVIRFTIDITLIIVTITTMFLMDITMTLLILSGIFITLLFVFILNKKLYDHSLMQRNYKSGLLSFVSSRLPLILTIKSFNRQLIEDNSFIKRSEKVYKSGLKYQFISSILSVIVPGILYLTIGVVLFYIYINKQNINKISHDHLLTFILLFITVLPVFRRILRVSSIWKIGSISFEKFHKVMGLSSEPNSNDLRNLNLTRGDIRFKNVCFSYGKSANILSKFNLEIEGGTTTVLFSKLNLPKSTIIKLILGLYSPEKGTISIDGNLISKLDLKSLRKRISVLSENFPLLGETVFEACSYSKSEDKRPYVQTLLDDLQKNVSIDNKLNLDTKIGDNGNKLTDFQKQTVLAARTILSEKPIVLIENLSNFIENPIYPFLLKNLEKFQKELKTIVIFDTNYIVEFDTMNPKINEL